MPESRKAQRKISVPYYVSDQVVLTNQPGFPSCSTDENSVSWKLFPRSAWEQEWGSAWEQEWSRAWKQE